MISELRALARSIARLVDGFPPEDDHGLGVRLMGAAHQLPTSVAGTEAAKTSRDRRKHQAQAEGSIAELGYLVSQSRRLHFGSQEARTSASGRIDDILHRLRSERAANA